MKTVIFPSSITVGNEFEIPAFINAHVHLREGHLQGAVLPYFDVYSRVVCIGNLKQPLDTTERVFAYHAKLRAKEKTFISVRTMMITSRTTPAMVKEAIDNGIRFLKILPSGSSFGSQNGIQFESNDVLYPIFELIVKHNSSQKRKCFAMVHAERLFYSNGQKIPLISREQAAIKIIQKWLQDFPELPLNIEHVSSAPMIRFIDSLPEGNEVGMGLTIQHATQTYRDAFGNYARYVNMLHEKVYDPFNFFLPISKFHVDREAVLKKILSGDKNCWLALDSAPHWEADKMKKNNPGAFYGPAEIPRVLELFEKAGKWRGLVPFSSQNWLDRHGYRHSGDTITVRREDWILPVRRGKIRFTSGGEKVRWKIVKKNGKRVFGFGID